MRTPLAALKIQAQVALRSIITAERNAALENILHDVDRANRLVEQLLTLTNVDPETASLDYQQVDLHRLTASIMADIESLASAKQIEIRLESDSPCHMLGESTQLGGHVSVGVSDNEGVKLQICDSGVGIPEAEREQVLKRFYRITGSDEEGSGLGLFIVRCIAQRHGARLELSDNEVGSGLLVSVIWPIK